MSIYSGFPTRRDENKYNELLSKLILMLQHHLLEFIQNTELSHKKIVGYVKVISKMKEYEEHKYLPPKFTQLLEPLCKVIGFTNVNAVVEEVVINEDKVKGGLEKLKNMKLPVERHRLRSKQIEEEASEYSRPNKTSSLQEELQRPLSRPNKKKLMDVNELREKKRDLNINYFSRDQVRLQPPTPLNFDQAEPCKTKTQHCKISASHPLIGSVKSSKNYFRYKASNALTQTQENMQKRQVPLREQMRKRLKTSCNEADSEL